MTALSTMTDVLKKKWIVTSLATAILAIVGITLIWLQRTDDSTDTVKIKKGNIIEAVYGLGTVTANQSYQVKLGVTGTIAGIYVVEGDTVAKGKPLVAIDQGVVFNAPFPGTVTSVPFKPGETVFSQTPIVTLINLKDRYIVVSLEQESALRIRPAQHARISFETLRGQTYQGKVRSIYPDPQNSQFFVRIDIPELPETILPGMTGDVAIEIAQRSDVLLIPISAVQSGRVLTRSGHLRKKTQITLGAVDGHWAEITSGDLHEGDEVILPHK